MSILKIVSEMFMAVIKFFLLVLRTIFGRFHWEPPTWVRVPGSWVMRFLRFLWQWSFGAFFTQVCPYFSRMHALPLKSKGIRLGILAGSLVLIAGAIVGIVYMINQPKPEIALVELKAPDQTRYGEQIVIDNLEIRFNKSVAPMDQAGKVITQGIELSPKIDGTWQWESDNRLVFEPKSDWPIEETYNVSLDRKGLIAEHIKLSDYSLEFTVTPFTLNVTQQFYQDPQDAKLKKGVFTLRSNYPLDTETLTKHIQLQLITLKKNNKEIKKSCGFNLLFNQWKTEAYIHSDALAIPEESTTLKLKIDKGVAPAQGKSKYKSELDAAITIPTLYDYFHVGQAQLSFVPNQNEIPEPVLTLEFTDSVKGETLARALRAYLLPEFHPKDEKDADKNPYVWDDPMEIGQDILKKSQKLDLKWVATEFEFSPIQGFNYIAPAGRYVYLKIDKGLTSYGGYILAKSYDVIESVPEYPKEVRIQGQGAILSLGGSRSLSIYSHQVEKLVFEVGRVLPEYVSHLVSQSQGDFNSFRFYGDFDQNNLVERFTEIKELKKVTAGIPQYTAFNLGKYLGAGQSPVKRGLFFVKVEEYKPEEKKKQEEQIAEEEGEPEGEYESEGEEGEGEEEGASEEESGGRRNSDGRFILITDLGFVVKDSLNQGHDVFVTSFSKGGAVEGALVQVLGKNGLAIAQAVTGPEGHARLPKLSDFKREQAPTVYLVTKGNDLSFMPFQKSERRLDFSRFDIGGESNARAGNQLQAYLFSDRGIYRPGDLIHIGLILKSADWKQNLADLPMEVEFSDPRGQVVRTQKIRFNKEGFEQAGHQLRDNSPTGDYQVQLLLIKDKDHRQAISSTRIKVQEFLPDRLKISSRISQSTTGWLAPTDLKALVSLHNLFGTPSVGHKVLGHLTISAASPYFRSFKDYTFSDPLKTKSDQNFNEEIGEQKTNEKGEAVFDLDLERFGKGIYHLTFSAEGFELEGGRSVNTNTEVLLSPLKYLIGSKTDGSLDYISKNSQRSLNLIAVGNDLKTVPANGLKMALIESKYVSVLTKQSNGTYKYESKQREVKIKEANLNIPKEGLNYTVPTENPGKWFLVAYDPKDSETELMRIGFMVAGKGNLSRSLEREAELSIHLNKPDYAPGEEIELSIIAPYTGTGLITIERDKIFSHKWFRTEQNATIERIRLPENLEGNAYVTVTFVRDLNSQEIYMSPLSYGVVPFMIDRSKRTLPIKLECADLVKPGEKLNISYQSKQPGKIVIFAVDEGILQVARYKTPDPLSGFFAKRALETTTWQILDLILPEIKQLLESAATGGDEGEQMLKSNLNPFKRKRKNPVVFWSGIIPIDNEKRTLTYQVPDYFNGTLRVMAVAVSDSAIGVFNQKSISRGDFVISPNLPTFAAPGDQFSLTVAVANNLIGSGKEAKVKVALTASDHLEVIGTNTQELNICEMCEQPVLFTVKAKQKLGSATTKFTVSSGSQSVSLSEDLSVRPLTPYITTLSSGYFIGSKHEEAVTRRMYPEYRIHEAGISNLPLLLAKGLNQFLSTDPYLCTEQVTSRAFPNLVLMGHKEFGIDPNKANEQMSKTIEILQSRQNSEGAFGLYAANEHVSDFASVYALHFLMEAREQHFNVPAEMIEKGTAYLRALIAKKSNTFQQERIKSYALYLLVRQGLSAGSLAEILAGRLKEYDAKQWKGDLAYAYLASAYKLLKMDKLADDLIEEVPFLKQVPADYEYYHDALIHNSVLLYLTARHFPNKLTAINDKKLAGFLSSTCSVCFNTLSGSYAILALDAYAHAGIKEGLGKYSLAEIRADGKTEPLILTTGMLPLASFSEQATKLVFKNEGELPVFYAVTQAGFDLVPPKQVVKEGIEAMHEYLDLKGNAIQTCKVGEQILVRVKARALSSSQIHNSAVVDLLPGGFELVYEGDESGSEQKVSSSWKPMYIDRREDRVVLYDHIGSNLQEYVYRIKAVNAGTYQIPPILAQALYERSVRAYAGGGTIFTITK
ncbi:MAG: alpha-2-macroglobulin family protein [Desulfobacteraceae bacterium]|nr:MAG: alpha-2-macroglobulin family protein [Desulfobacteraceae bacterium]